MTKVKICGIRTPEAIELINEAKPDFAGFIMSPDFWRYVPAQRVRELSKTLDSGIIKVGVFVAQPEKELAEALLSGTVDMLQLHGGEDNEYEKRLFEQLSNGGIENPSSKCIKAFRIRSAEDIENTRFSLCGTLLLDAYSENGVGGTGESFDWSLIKDIEKPFFLAGGLSPENVGRAIEDVQPYGVDASSSLETERKKDRKKILDFMAQIK